MDSECHSLHTPHCPCTLCHVTSEESNSTEQGWPCSPPSTLALPPGGIISVTTSYRQQLSAMTL